MGSMMKLGIFLFAPAYFCTAMVPGSGSMLSWGIFLLLPAYCYTAILPGLGILFSYGISNFMLLSELN